MSERWRRVADDAPSLSEQRGLDAISRCDKAFQRGVRVQALEFIVEVEAERVAKGRLDHETTEIIGRPAKPP